MCCWAQPWPCRAFQFWLHCTRRPAPPPVPTPPPLNHTRTPTRIWTAMPSAAALRMCRPADNLMSQAGPTFVAAQGATGSALPIPCCVVSAPGAQCPSIPSRQARRARVPHWSLPCGTHTRTCCCTYRRGSACPLACNKSFVLSTPVVLAQLQNAPPRTLPCLALLPGRATASTHTAPVCAPAGLSSRAALSSSTGLCHRCSIACQCELVICLPVYTGQDTPALSLQLSSAESRRGKLHASAFMTAAVGVR